MTAVEPKRSFFFQLPSMLLRPLLHKGSWGFGHQTCQKSLPHNPLYWIFQNKCSIMLPPFISYQEICIVTEMCLAIKVSNLLGVGAVVLYFLFGFCFVLFFELEIFMKGSSSILLSISFLNIFLLIMLLQLSQFFPLCPPLSSTSIPSSNLLP